VGVQIYAADVIGAYTAFFAALRWCFRFCVAVCMLLFALLCSVIGLFLSLLRFGVGGSILYMAIFYRA
jgi:hypothetical protein